MEVDKQKLGISKVGNQTSSQDPQAVNSRVFVGNLNTFQIVKTDVEKLFQKYGRIAGISMHKGYAFVQFTSPFDARSACLGEDAKTLCGQLLDVNMVNEPKAHVTKLKAQKRKEKEGPSVLSYYVTALGTIVQQPGPMATAKRARVEDEGEAEEEDALDDDVDIDNLKAYSTPDILICGNCRMMFSDIGEMIDHKRMYCKLRFTCKCVDERDSTVPDFLECTTCHAGFEDPWDLMEHVQDAHTMNIYQLSGTGHDDNYNSTEHSNSNNTVSCNNGFCS